MDHNAQDSKIEGYWYANDRYRKMYPMPVAREEPFPEKEAFLKVLSEKEADAEVHSYRGFSGCRICRKRNGSREFERDGWRWPEGYRHYVEDHNVVPSPEFMQYILSVKN